MSEYHSEFDVEPIGPVPPETVKMAGFFNREYLGVVCGKVQETTLSF